MKIENKTTRRVVKISSYAIFGILCLGIFLPVSAQTSEEIRQVAKMNGVALEKAAAIDSFFADKVCILTTHESGKSRPTVESLFPLREAGTSAKSRGFGSEWWRERLIQNEFSVASLPITIYNSLSVRLFVNARIIPTVENNQVSDLRIEFSNGGRQTMIDTEPCRLGGGSVKVLDRQVINDGGRWRVTYDADLTQVCEDHAPRADRSNWFYRFELECVSHQEPRR